MEPRFLFLFKVHPDIALAAVRQNGLAIELTPIGMKHDRQISLASAMDTLLWDGMDPRQHPERRATVSLGGDAAKNAVGDLQLALAAAVQNPAALDLLVPELRRSLQALLALDAP